MYFDDIPITFPIKIMPFFVQNKKLHMRSADFKPESKVWGQTKLLRALEWKSQGEYWAVIENMYHRKIGKISPTLNVFKWPYLENQVPLIFYAKNFLKHWGYLHSSSYLPRMELVTIFALLFDYFCNVIVERIAFSFNRIAIQPQPL